MNKHYKNTKTGRGCSGSVCPEGDHYEEISAEEWRELLKELQLAEKFKEDVYEPGKVEHEVHTISDYDKVYWSHFTDEGLGMSAFSGGYIRQYNSADRDLTSGKTPEYIKTLKNGDELHPIDGVYMEPLDIYIIFAGIHRLMAWDSEGQDIKYFDLYPSANLEVSSTYISGYKEELELIELGELDSTTITETQYKNILKKRNEWRNM